MSVTCYECGLQLKSSLALSTHEGSRPCRLAKTWRLMGERGWEACSVFDAEAVLRAAGVDYETGPSEYLKGDFVRGVRNSKAGLPMTKAHFSRPDLREAVWCPAWAVPIVNAPIRRETRIRVLRWVLEDVVPHVNALMSAIALGGIDVIDTLGE